MDRETLAKEGLTYVKYWVNKYRKFNRSNDDELESEALVGLAEACINYDPHGAANFKTWADMFIHRSLINFIEKEKIYRKISIPSVILEDMYLNGAPLQDEQVIHKEEIKRLRERIIEITPSLNQREFFLLYQYLLEEREDRMTLREIAEIYNTSATSLMRDIHRIEEMLQ